MKRILGWICCAALTVLAVSVDAKEPQTFTQKEDEAHYLAGAVPVEDGQVVFTKEYLLPGMSQDAIFEGVKNWIERSQKRDRDLILARNVVSEDKAKGEIYVQSNEFLVIVDKGLSLDRAQVSYLQSYTCSPGKCVSTIRNLRYVYEGTIRNPEGWITDDYALDKGKTKIYPGVRRMRIKTVDRMDDLFAGLNDVFNLAQLEIAKTLLAATPPATATPPVAAAPVVAEQTTASQIIPATPLTPAIPVVSEAHAATSLPMEEGAVLSGYKRISPERIPGNIIKMLTDDSMLVTAGQDSKFNMMTAGWGGLGVLFEKPVAFCFVSPARHTWQLLDQGDTYTLSFYTEAYRDALNICGTTSGRDTDKVQASGLTPTTTPSGAKAFSEAWIVIECRKVMQQPLTQSAIVDPADKAKWGENPFYTMFVGEILNVWIK